LLGLEPKYLASHIGLCGGVPPRTSVISVVIENVFHYVAFGIYSLIVKVLFNLSELIELVCSAAHPLLSIEATNKNNQSHLPYSKTCVSFLLMVVLALPQYEETPYHTVIMNNSDFPFPLRVVEI
jgi:hypothetical protein